MFDITQIFELAKGQSFGGMLNSVLLALILLNIRSLKNAILQIEDGHDKRIKDLEADVLILKGKGA